MKICIILGTRPEIIKLSPIIRYCEDKKNNFFVIHTNQHYSKDMDKVFFEDLNLQKPLYNLSVGSGTHGKQTGLMLERIEEVLLNEKPDLVIVQGDTNSVLAGALAAVKLGIKIMHIESGLRSWDRTMPEETNRIIVDSISDFLQCPTLTQKNNLINEGINERKIFVTGNTISDSIAQNVLLAKKKSLILEKLNLNPKKYLVLTMHRPSNVDVKSNMIKILQAIEHISKENNIKIVFPIHPRTRNNLENFNISVSENIKIIEPVGYLDMLKLLSNSLLLLTDSGGLQEEACILEIPTLTLRDNTERPETLEVGANLLVGNDFKKIIDGYNFFIKNEKKWANPFGMNVVEKIFANLLKEQY